MLKAGQGTVGQGATPIGQGNQSSATTYSGTLGTYTRNPSTGAWEPS